MTDGNTHLIRADVTLSSNGWNGDGLAKMPFQEPLRYPFLPPDPTPERGL